MATIRVSADSVDIAVFARAPQPGATKTRLIPALGAAGAARLQRRLILNAMHNAISIGSGNITLWCAPDTQHHFFRALHTPVSYTHLDVYKRQVKIVAGDNFSNASSFAHFELRFC